MVGRREDRFCVNCKHGHEAIIGQGRPFLVCERPNLVDLVTGERHAVACEVERNSADSHRCGPSAWHYEAKDAEAAA